MAGELIDVGGTRIFVDLHGAESAPPLLFIHGSPGQGCYDFMQAQGSRLARSLRVIGVDQRGALRSDPLPAEPALTMALLVSDYEDLRRQLGLTDWAILGHSFGGGVALAYASSQPRSVRRTIFDCPCWDGDLSDRSKLDVAASRLAALGRDAAAGRCRQLAVEPGRLGPADDVYGATLALDEHYMELSSTAPSRPLSSISCSRAPAIPRSSGTVAGHIRRCWRTCTPASCRCLPAWPSLPCCCTAQTT